MKLITIDKQCEFPTLSPQNLPISFQILLSFPPPSADLSSIPLLLVPSLPPSYRLLLHSYSSGSLLQLLMLPNKLPQTQKLKTTILLCSQLLWVQNMGRM